MSVKYNTIEKLAIIKILLVVDLFILQVLFNTVFYVKTIPINKVFNLLKTIYLLYCQLSNGFLNKKMNYNLVNIYALTQKKC